METITSALSACDKLTDFCEGKKRFNCERRCTTNKNSSQYHTFKSACFTFNSYLKLENRAPPDGAPSTTGRGRHYPRGVNKIPFGPAVRVPWRLVGDHFRVPWASWKNVGWKKLLARPPHGGWVQGAQKIPNKIPKPSGLAFSAKISRGNP